jgi:hypothetical protein
LAQSGLRDAREGRAGSRHNGCAGAGCFVTFPGKQGALKSRASDEVLDLIRSPGTVRL